jgi:hypothetical protein
MFNLIKIRFETIKQNAAIRQNAVILAPYKEPLSLKTNGLNLK